VAAPAVKHTSASVVITRPCALDAMDVGLRVKPASVTV
jgi:hypothetical protein